MVVPDGLGPLTAERLRGSRGNHAQWRGPAMAATRDLIERLPPLLPNVQEAEFVARSARAGEPGLALGELGAALTDERASLSSADRDQLRVLLDRYGEPTEDVDRLNIAEPSDR